MPTRTPQELEQLEYKLGKRGFKQDDAFLHECTTCHELAVRTYKIAGKVGGRDIGICVACGAAKSWRSNPGANERVEDAAFDIDDFLK